eukprot:6763965-Pyramimonas_sp.AAC.1
MYSPSPSPERFFSPFVPGVLLGLLQALHCQNTVVLPRGLEVARPLQPVLERRRWPTSHQPPGVSNSGVKPGS